MSFFQRVLSYVANELLVNRLANKCVPRCVAPRGVPVLTLALRSTQRNLPALCHPLGRHGA